MYRHDKAPEADSESLADNKVNNLDMDWDHGMSICI